MLKLIRVMLSIYNAAAPDFLPRANAVYLGMNQNPDYPNPPVPMPDLRAAIDDCSTATTAALDGGAKAAEVKKASAEKLRRQLRKLAHHVEGHCNDDMPTFLSSGFQPVIGARTRTNPVSESIRKIAPGPVSGQFEIALLKEPRAVSYEVSWAAVNGSTPGEWARRPVPTTQPVTFPGLTPGTTYAFKARALLRSGDFTDWSEPVTRICTSPPRQTTLARR